MLIFLTGASCSGKTSIAAALQRLDSRRWLHWEADRHWPTVRQGTLDGDDTYRRQVVLGVHESLAALGRTGLDVIVDGSLPTERALHQQCLDILRSSPGTRVVGVRCDLTVLRLREARRPDRDPGWAETQVPIVFEGVELDALLDTSTLSPDECARELINCL